MNLKFVKSILLKSKRNIKHITKIIVNKKYYFYRILFRKDSSNCLGELGEYIHLKVKRDSIEYGYYLKGVRVVERFMKRPDNYKLDNPYWFLCLSVSFK